MEGAEKKDEDKMTQISIDYGVLCSETSLVAVERVKEKVKRRHKALLTQIINKVVKPPNSDSDSNSEYNSAT